MAVNDCQLALWTYQYEVQFYKIFNKFRIAWLHLENLHSVSLIETYSSVLSTKIGSKDLLTVL